MNMRRLIAILLPTICIFANSVLAGTLTQIYICPGDMLFRKEMQQQFQVFGLDLNGNEVPVPGAITWSCDPAAGTITQTGLFTAGSTTGMYRSGVTASVPGGMSAVSVIEIVSPNPSGGYAMESSWGNFGAGHLNDIRSIAVGPTGAVYVNDLFSNRMQVFDSSGNYVTMWGSGGNSSIYHNTWIVEDITTDSSGNIYVADLTYKCIRKFNSNGDYIRSIGGYGTSDGDFKSPSDVAVDAAGSIYALDYQLKRIQKFDSAGNFLLKWGSIGTGNDQFTDPRCIAVSPDGHVYVADFGANCVKIFDSNGSYITQWSNSGQFNNPIDLDVDTNGFVYVSDSDSSYHARVQKFNSAGSLQVSWNVTTNWKIAVDSSGNIYTTDSNNVYKYTSSGQLIKSWGMQDNLRGQLNSPSRVVVDGLGNCFVLSKGTYSIQKFDSKRNSVARWGTYGTEDGQFTYPTGMALGPDNCIYVVDESACRVSVFDSNGNFLRKWGRMAYSLGGFWEPYDIAIDTNGIVNVCDSSRRVVLKFNALGSFLGEWSYAVSGESNSPWASQIAIDTQNYVYVADTGNDLIKKFNSQGNLIMQFGSGKLNFLEDIAFGANGSIYVADANEIDIFDSAGNWVKQLGSFGTGPGQFIVYGVALDSVGNLYVADNGNNRIIKFVPQLSTSSTGKTKSLPDGQFVSMTGQIVTAGSSELSDCFYIESADRFAGIKVTGKSASRGTTASIDGILSTINGERLIKASSVSTTAGGSVDPLGMSVAKVGGGMLGLQGALTGRNYTGSGYEHLPMNGLSNIGLLVRVWGKVRSVDAVGRAFIINDGSTYDLKCSVPLSVNLPAKDDFVSVTGISSTETSTSFIMPMLRVRIPGDILLMN